MIVLSSPKSLFSNFYYSLVITISLFSHLTSANTEKIIISGPPLVQKNLLLRGLLHGEDEQQQRKRQGIPILTPDLSDWSIRHHVHAAFPNSSFPDGLSSWYLLSDLIPGQDYEVRICWATTQPTVFKLSAYEPQEVLNDESLLVSLFSTFDSPSGFASFHTKPWSTEGNGIIPGDATAALMSSAILLEIRAAADYFTTNLNLMSQVPPVLVDVILDPYVMPGVPRSLLPTIGCIVMVALASFFLARTIASWLEQLATSDVVLEKKSQ